jgi:tetratricopeptide (TPR) repeat protein
MFLRLRRLLLQAKLPALLCVMLLGLSGCFLFGGGGGGNDSEEIVGPEQTLSQDFVTTFELGQTLKEAGQVDEALLIYYEALAQDSTGYGASKCWNVIGDIYLDDAQYKKALEAYQTVMTNFTVIEDSVGVEMKIKFVQAALLVREERLKVAKEGPTKN